MTITASQVAELRKKTGCGMMECKKALVEAEGNMDEAIKVLRERGLSVAAKKADRIAADGVVDIKKAGDLTAMIEVNSETDFVAKNETFRAFVSSLLDTILAEQPADVAALLACKCAGTDVTVDDKMKEMVFTIGEKLDIRRFILVRGTTSTYIHGKGSIGVVVVFDADEAAASNEGFAEFAKNIALQVAAYPTVYLDRASVPASVSRGRTGRILNKKGWRRSAAIARTLSQSASRPPSRKTTARRRRCAVIPSSRRSTPAPAAAAAAWKNGTG